MPRKSPSAIPSSCAVAGGPGTTAGRVEHVVPAVNPADADRDGRRQCASRGRDGGHRGSRAYHGRARARALLVPESAIVEDPQQGDSVVFVQQRKPDGSTTFAQRTVRIAHEDGTTAHLASGVAAGERVAAQGAFELLAPCGE